MSYFKKQNEECRRMYKRMHRRWFVGTEALWRCLHVCEWKVRDIDKSWLMGIKIPTVQVYATVIDLDNKLQTFVLKEYEYQSDEEREYALLLAEELAENVNNAVMVK